MTTTRSDLPPGTLEMLVLRTLAAGRRHGYGIARRIRSVSEEVLSIEEGTLYPALHRMEKRGWIRAEWGLSESNRRAKYYMLTAAGRKRMQAEEANWERVSTAIERVLRAQPGDA